jgi:hypothetical protein
MKRVTAFLTTPLFSSSTESHLPAGTVRIEGELLNQENNGALIQATAYANARGKALDGQPTTLFLPLHKIDHLSFSG